MNWANRITLGRLALTVFFVVALNSSWQYARTTALVIFLIAGGELGKTKVQGDQDMPPVSSPEKTFR